MGTPEDVAAETYFTPSEVEINKCVIHHWECRTHHGPEFHCDFWDCPHKIQDGEKFYLELYPEGQYHSYCLECSAYFMAQAIDYLLSYLSEKGVSKYPADDCPEKPCEGCASEGVC